MLTVVAAGPFTCVQDLGRPGLARWGVSPSGAADRAAHRLANRMLGNPDSAATLEVTLGGLSLRSDAFALVCVTGPPTPVRVNGTSVGSHAVLALRPGDELGITRPARGLRSYLAVRGGILAPATLGSRSHDVLSGLGPPVLAVGDLIGVGPVTGTVPGVDVVPVRDPPETLTLRPGPRRDWFTTPAWARLLTASFTVGADSDRVAVRLEGATLPRVDPAAELPSEGLVRGAVQVPPSGRPLIFGADHPVTGGYPVIAVLDPDASDHAAQLRPGDSVRFRCASPGADGR